jgi:hypothetical protein
LPKDFGCLFKTLPIFVPEISLLILKGCINALRPGSEDLYEKLQTQSSARSLDVILAVGLCPGAGCFGIARAGFFVSGISPC